VSEELFSILFRLAQTDDSRKVLENYSAINPNKKDVRAAQQPTIAQEPRSISLDQIVEETQRAILELIESAQVIKEDGKYYVSPSGNEYKQLHIFFRGHLGAVAVDKPELGRDLKELLIRRAKGSGEGQFSFVAVADNLYLTAGARAAANDISRRNFLAGTVVSAGLALAESAAAPFRFHSPVLGQNYSISSEGQSLIEEPLPNVYILENDGGLNYPGEEYYLNREEIVRRYMQRYPDLYDHFIIFTSDPNDQGKRTANYAVIRNRVKGIGMDVYDQSEYYGGGFSKLLGTADMKTLSQWRIGVGQNDAVQTWGAIVHELNHQYMVYTRAAGAIPADKPIAYGYHFWDGLQSPDNYYGTSQDNWVRDNGDGTASILYRRDRRRIPKVHPFGLYALGLLRPEDITAEFLTIRDLSRHLGGRSFFENGRIAGSEEVYRSDVARVRI